MKHKNTDCEIAPSVTYPSHISEQLADLSPDESSWVLTQITRDRIMGELSDREKWVYLQGLIDRATTGDGVVEIMFRDFDVRALMAAR
jgi:hypothetical protein